MNLDMNRISVRGTHLLVQVLIIFLVFSILLTPYALADSQNSSALSSAANATALSDNLLNLSAPELPAPEISSDSVEPEPQYEKPVYGPIPNYNSGDCVGVEPPASGTWKINNTTICKNTVITLNGNLNIEPGYKLVFDNVTLRMNVTSNGQYWINDYGIFNVTNQSFITNGDTAAAHYIFYVRPGGFLNLSDSNVSGFGYTSNDHRAGIYINNNASSVIKNSTIHSNLYGVIYRNTTGNLLYNTTIYSPSVSVYLNTNSVNNTIQNNTLISTNSYGAYLYRVTNNSIVGNYISSHSVGIYLYQSNNNSILRNFANSSASYGNYLYNSSSNSILNNTFISVKSYGVYLNNHAGINLLEQNNVLGYYYGLYTYNHVSNNTFRNNTFNSSHSYGIWARFHSNNNTFVNNTIYGHSFAFWIYQYCNNNSILNNTILSSTNLGLYVSYHSNNTKIINNNISSHGVGIYLYYHDNNTEILNNDVTSSASSSLYFNNNNLNVVGKNNIIKSYSVGIYLSNRNNNSLFANNSVSSSNSYGVYLYTFNRNNSFIENNITSGTRYGIYFYRKSDYNLFYKNNISSSADDGIQLINSSNNNFTLNNITSGSGSGDYGVLITSNSSNNTFKNNSIVTGYAQAVYVQYSDNNTFIQNNLTTPSEDGIILYNADNNTFIKTKVSAGTGSGDYGVYMGNVVRNNRFIDFNITRSYYALYFDASSFDNNFTNCNLTSGSYVVYTRDSSGNELTNCVFSNNLTSNDIYLRGSGNLTFTNVSFNHSQLTYYAGSTVKLFVRWFLNLNVTDHNAAGLSNANVSIYDKNDNLLLNKTTNSSGYLPKTAFTEYYQERSGRTYLTNFTINAIRNGFAPNSTSLNLSTNQNVEITLVNPVPNLTSVTASPTPIGPGQTILIDAIGENDLNGDPIQFFCGSSPTPNASNTDCTGGSTSDNSAPYNLNCTFSVPNQNGTYTEYCRVFDGVSYSEAKSTSFIVDSSPPSVNQINLNPNSTDDVDPGVPISITANVTDDSSISSVIFQYKISNSSTWTNDSMDYNSSIGLYVNASFTPNLNGTWQYRIFTNDTLGNSRYTSIQNISVQYDYSWQVIPQSFGAVSALLSHNVTLGTLFINNTGDYPLNFDLSSNWQNTFYNTSKSFNLTNKSSINLTITVTGASMPAINTIVIKVNATNSTANPGYQYVNGSLVSYTGGPYLYAEITKYNLSVSPGDTGIELSAKVKNIGNETADNAWLLWALPAGWVVTSGDLNHSLGQLLPGSMLPDEVDWANITIDISSDAPTGLKTINATPGFLNSTNRTRIGSRAVSVVKQGNTIIQGGGGGGSIGGGGAGGVEVVHPGLLTNYTYFDVTRGKSNEYPIEVKNIFPGAVLENLKLYVYGYYAQYVTVYPSEFDNIGQNESRVFYLKISAPSYLNRGEYPVNVTLVGDIVYGENRSVVYNLVEKRKVTLVVHEVSPKDANASLLAARSDINELVAAGISVGKAKNLLAQAKQAYSKGDYGVSKKLTDQIHEIKLEAFEAKSVIGVVQQQINMANKRRLSVPKSTRLLRLAIAAFNREDYSNALVRAKEARSAVFLETSGKISIIWFVETYYPEILGGSIAALFSGYFLYRKLSLSLITTTLQNLNKEETTIFSLMEGLQNKFFKKKEISPDQFHKLMYEYEKRLTQIQKKRVSLRAKRIGLLNFANEAKVLENESNEILKLIKQTQIEHFKHRKLSKDIYDRKMKAYWEQLAAVEERRIAVEALQERKRLLSKAKEKVRSIKLPKIGGGKIGFPTIKIKQQSKSRWRLKFFKTEDEKMEEMRKLIQEKFDQGRLYR